MIQHYLNDIQEQYHNNCISLSIHYKKSIIQSTILKSNIFGRIIILSGLIIWLII